MDGQALEVFKAASVSVPSFFAALMEWANMMDGNERDEALFHINNMAIAWDELTLSLADNNGIPLA